MALTDLALASDQWLNLEVSSVSRRLLEPERASLVGEALSRLDVLAPEKLGPRDPARTPVTDLPRQLSEWAESAKDSRMARVNLARVSDPHMQGGLLVHRDPLARGKRLVSTVEVGYGAEWFAEDADRLDLLPSLLADVVDAALAFHGVIGFSLQSWQLRQFWSKANQARGFRPSAHAGRPKIERHLEDVHWVEYFGPAFVAKWGPDRLAGLGVRQEPTRCGGVIVWATEHPWHYEHDAGGIRSYAWKAPFYEALGEDTIWHEDFAEGEPGQYLPTLEQHQEQGQ